MADDYGLALSGLSPELYGDARSIARRQKIADALQAQGQEPINNPMSGGWAVPISPLQILGKLAASGAGAYKNRQLDKEFSGLQDKQRAGVADAIMQYQNGMRDRTVSAPDTGAMTGTMDSQDAPMTQQTIKADPRAAVTALLANQYAPKPLQQMAVADLTRQDTQAYQDKVRKDTQNFKAIESSLTRDQQIKLLDAKLANAGTPEERQQYALEKIALLNENKLGASKQVKMPDGSVQIMTEQQLRDMANGTPPAAPVAAPVPAAGGAPRIAPPVAPAGLKPGQGNPTDRMRILTEELATEQARKPTDAADAERQKANIESLQREIGSANGAPQPAPKPALPGASLGTKPLDPRYDPEKQRALAAAKAGGKVEGTNQANSQNQLPQLEAQTQQSLRLVDELLAHPGKKMAVGSASMLGIKHIPGTPAADFANRLDQIKGGQFMTAYQTLKGGGQITEVEGKKATDAIARMNASSSIAEFDKAAREFKDVLTSGLARAKQQAAVVQSPGTPRIVDW